MRKKGIKVLVFCALLPYFAQSSDCNTLFEQIVQRRNEILKQTPNRNQTKSIFYNAELKPEVERWAGEAMMDQALHRMKDLGLDALYTFETKDKKIISGRLLATDEWFEEGVYIGKHKKMESQILIESDEGLKTWVLLNEILPETFTVSHTPLEIPAEIFKRDLSGVARTVGFEYLGHNTRNIDTIGKIFQSRILKTNASGIGSEGFYSSPIHRESKTSMKEKTAAALESDNHVNEITPTLLLDLELLNQQNFYLNRGWNYGKVDRATLTAKDTNDLKRYFFVIGTKRSKDIPEVVFTQNITLDALKKVLVPKGSRERVIDYLRKNFSPYPIQYEDLIVEANP